MSIIPSFMKMTHQKQAGKYRCGTSCVATMTGAPIEGFFNRIQETNNIGEVLETSETYPIEYNNQKKYQPSDFIKILLERTSRRLCSENTVGGEQETNGVMLLEANGSVESSLDWANHKKLDKGQRRAIEIFCATYVITFYEEAQEGSEHGALTLSLYRDALERLVEKDENKTKHQLICFLHGPGGSGKSTVVDLFLMYAQQFSSFIEEFNFTSKTIRVTAMSGVAATVIGGETTHSALYINKKTPITQQNVEVWAETRVLIIDEMLRPPRRRHNSLYPAHEKAGCAVRCM